MVRYILLGFLVYFAFRFIFELVIPVIKTTRQVKKQFDSVREQQQQQYQQQQQSAKQATPNPKSSVDKDDYLEFEEI